jgi:hypothetical protein
MWLLPVTRGRRAVKGKADAGVRQRDGEQVAMVDVPDLAHPSIHPRVERVHPQFCVRNTGSTTSETLCGINTKSSSS